MLLYVLGWMQCHNYLELPHYTHCKIASPPPQIIVMLLNDFCYSIAQTRARPQAQNMAFQSGQVKK